MQAAWCVLVVRGAGGTVRAGCAGCPVPRDPVLGTWHRQKRTLNRWVTAAAIATLVTLVTLGGLNWLRIWQGG